MAGQVPHELLCSPNLTSIDIDQSKSHGEPFNILNKFHIKNNQP